MVNENKKHRGKSYAKRIADVCRIYDAYAHTGLSNREIWKRYVYPLYGVSERTFYNLLKASGSSCYGKHQEQIIRDFMFPNVEVPKMENRKTEYYKKTQE